MSFWERFYSLCLANETKPNTVAKELGFSTATCTQWKAGSIPSGERLVLLADRFQCSVDYLLGRTAAPECYFQQNNSGNIVNGDNSNSPLIVSNAENTDDEMQKEISSILSGLTFRERTELMTMIYQFADEHKKEGA